MRNTGGDEGAAERGDLSDVIGVRTGSVALALIEAPGASLSLQIVAEARECDGEGDEEGERGERAGETHDGRRAT